MNATEKSKRFRLLPQPILKSTEILPPQILTILRRRYLSIHLAMGIFVTIALFVLNIYYLAAVYHLQMYLYKIMCIYDVRCICWDKLGSP